MLELQVEAPQKYPGYRVAALVKAGVEHILPQRTHLGVIAGIPGDGKQVLGTYVHPQPLYAQLAGEADWNGIPQLDVAATQEPAVFHVKVGEQRVAGRAEVRYARDGIARAGGPALPPQEEIAYSTLSFCGFGINRLRLGRGRRFCRGVG